MPYSKYHVVARPFASTDPFRVALVAEIEEAAPVTTPGGASVVNSPSAPRLVPALEVATTR